MKEVRRKFSRLPWHNQGSEHEPIISGAGDGRGWVHSPSPSRGSAWTPTSLVPAPKGDPGPLLFSMKRILYGLWSFQDKFPMCQRR